MDAGAEAMGFSHLSLDVTLSKCELFRDVIAPWCGRWMDSAHFAAENGRRNSVVFDPFTTPNGMLVEMLPASRIVGKESEETT